MTKIQNSAFNLASHQLPAQLVENTDVRATPQAMDSEGLEVESRLRLFWKLPTWELQPQGKEIEMQTLIYCLFRVSASRSSQKYSEGQESGRPNYLVHLSLLCLLSSSWSKYGNFSPHPSWSSLKISRLEFGVVTDSLLSCPSEWWSSVLDYTLSPTLIVVHIPQSLS